MHFVFYGSLLETWNLIRSKLLLPRQIQAGHRQDRPRQQAGHSFQARVRRKASSS